MLKVKTPLSARTKAVKNPCFSLVSNGVEHFQELALLKSMARSEEAKWSRGSALYCRGQRQHKLFVPTRRSGAVPRWLLSSLVRVGRPYAWYPNLRRRNIHRSRACCPISGRVSTLTFDAV